MAVADAVVNDAMGVGDARGQVFSKELERALRSFCRQELQSRRPPSPLRIAADVGPRVALAALGVASMTRSDLPLACFGAGLLAVATVSLVGSWFHEALHGNILRSSTARYLVRVTCTAPLAVSQSWWNYKHLRGHHPNPQDPERDPDIQFGPIARVCNDQEWRPTHRLQAWTFWLFSPLTTIAMAMPGEFRHLRSARRVGTRGHFWRYAIEKYTPSLLFWLPFYWTRPLPTALVVSGVFWLTTGIIAAAVTQAQHTALTRPLGVDDPLPLTKQLLSSSDLTSSLRMWWWVSGGTSKHVVHHLVPKLTFLELPAATIRLNECLRPFALEVHTFPSFRAVLKSHTRILRDLGRPPSP